MGFAAGVGGFGHFADTLGVLRSMNFARGDYQRRFTHLARFGVSFLRERGRMAAAAG